MGVKLMKRCIYELYNLYIYFTIPVIMVLFILFFIGFEDLPLEVFQNFKIEISLSLIGVLLTILGLFASLPDSNFLKLLKRYNHDTILYRTLLLGILSSAVVVALTLIGKFEKGQYIMLIVSLVETVIASIHIYRIITTKK